MVSGDVLLVSSALYKAFEKRDGAAQEQEAQEQPQPVAISPAVDENTAPADATRRIIDPPSLQRFLHDVQAADASGALSAPCEAGPSLESMFVPHTRRGLSLTIK